MVETSFDLLKYIISYDATKLKNMVKFMGLLGPFSLTQSQIAKVMITVTLLQLRQ